MLQLRNSSYTGLTVIEELDQDESYLNSDHFDPNVLDTPIGWIRLENGSFVKNLAKKILYDARAFENLFLTDDPDVRLSLSLRRNDELADKIFPALLKSSLENQGEENCVNEIASFLLENPYKLPEDIVAWEIPEFDDEIPAVERILLIRKL